MPRVSCFEADAKTVNVVSASGFQVTDGAMKWLLSGVKLTCVPPFCTCPTTRANSLPFSGLVATGPPKSKLI
ncbi:hypothetical protein ACVWXO_008743 [Bradyrhizobium sp. LM2.7]